MHANGGGMERGTSFRLFMDRGLQSAREARSPWKAFNRE
jgi:hypothetical protein